MNLMPRRLKHVMRAANVATVATTVISSALGKKGSAAPLDTTAADAAINAGAMYAWSAVLEGVFGNWVRRGDDVGAKIGRAAVAGATVSALAYVADRYVVPKRLTPGFEKRLSPMALATTYGVLAASLAAGAVWASRSEA